MKNAMLLVLASFLLFTARAQENISGIINAYAAVQSIDYCNNTLQVSTTNGFAEGDALILIQMQGAEIDVSNAASFGSITNLGQAGLYERAVITAVNGLEITLEKVLANEYDTDGAVQIVSMPDYSSGAIVSNTLTARAWDGSTGGVLAFEASGLTLQAPIDVSGKGFRGGSSVLDYTGDCNFLDNFNAFAYPEASIRGAHKGEGISAIVSNLARGRGSQANGGGGGNDHNAGGGGGGNINAGGTGGQNNNPSFFGCDGQNPGQGGKAITGISAGRLFMGGGGGAGHGNNDGASDGGTGGGIVILRTTTITSNDFPIRANGLPAATSGGDGAGGGGGGGAIALLLANGDGDGLLLEALGGNGGDADNQMFDQCFGPGGGGGGGRILRSGAAMATTSLSGGQPGETFNSGSGSCGGGANNALAGPDGNTQAFEDIPEGNQDPAPFEILAQAGDTTICAGLSLTLPVSVQGAGLNYQWQVDEGSGFTGLQSGQEYGATNVPGLLINTVTNAMDGNVYRLQITGDCIGTVFTEPATLSVIPGPLAAFTYAVNGLQVTFDNTSVNADGYSWDFGDGEGSNDFEPTHTFPGEGTYTVTLLAGSSACGDTASFSTPVQILVQEPPQASFTPMPAAGCAPLSVLFNNTSTGGSGNSYQWLFPGGDPAASTDGAPIINYDNPGSYDVTLIATNNLGSDTFSLTGAVQVAAAPTADFGLSANGLTITLDNLSSGADSYLWDFGDGNTSTATAPTHTYDNSGDYEVSLTVTNICGSDVMVLPVAVAVQPAPLFSIDSSTVGCSPHTVYFMDESTGDYDSLRWDFPGGMPATASIPNPEVLYDAPGQYSVQLTLFWLGGEESITQAQAITVLEGPQADFTVAVNGLSATFTNLSANADSYLWDFGDGNTSTAANPAHTYNNSGQYEVSLTVTNGCGSDVMVFPIEIVQRPAPLFSTQGPPNGCPPHTVIFVNESTGDYDSLRWDFPGGMPATATSPNPEVVYNTPGTYAVRLTLFWAGGEETLAQSQAITVLERPQPAFTFELDGLTATFTNLSANATDFTWNFGDGTTSNEENPVHTFPGPGNYDVTLNASNQGECTRANGQNVFIQPNAAEEYSLPKDVLFFPNPTSGELRLQSERQGWYPVQWRFYNAQGQAIDSGVADHDKEWNLAQYPPGAYLLQLVNAEGWWTVRVLKY
ncbi:MAG: PKD domain-containing protein [Lewinellaceae bacterium]|nr:PKD domain-containing protein [Lewinellaceae bacterium]